MMTTEDARAWFRGVLIDKETRTIQYGMVPIRQEFRRYHLTESQQLEMANALSLQTDIDIVKQMQALERKWYIENESWLSKDNPRSVIPKEFTA